MTLARFLQEGSELRLRGGLGALLFLRIGRSTEAISSERCIRRAAGSGCAAPSRAPSATSLCSRSCTGAGGATSGGRVGLGAAVLAIATLAGSCLLGVCGLHSSHVGLADRGVVDNGLGVVLADHTAAALLV